MAFSIASNDFFDYLRFFYDKVPSNSDFFEQTYTKMVLRLFWWFFHHCAVALGWRTLAVCVVYCRCRSAATRQLCLLLHPKTSIRASLLTFPAAFSFTAPCPPFWFTLALYHSSNWLGLVFIAPTSSQQLSQEDILYLDLIDKVIFTSSIIMFSVSAS